MLLPLRREPAWPAAAPAVPAGAGGGGDVGQGSVVMVAWGRRTGRRGVPCCQPTPAACLSQRPHPCAPCADLASSSERLVREVASGVSAEGRASMKLVEPLAVEATGDRGSTPDVEDPRTLARGEHHSWKLSDVSSCGQKGGCSDGGLHKWRGRGWGPPACGREGRAAAAEGSGTGPPPPPRAEAPGPWRVRRCAARPGSCGAPRPRATTTRAGGGAAEPERHGMHHSCMPYRRPALLAAGGQPALPVATGSAAWPHSGLTCGLVAQPNAQQHTSWCTGAAQPCPAPPSTHLRLLGVLQLQLAAPGVLPGAGGRGWGGCSGLRTTASYHPSTGCLPHAASAGADLGQPGA